MSDSVRPHRRQPTRFPCPWDSPGKNTGVGCHFPLRKIRQMSFSWSEVKLLSHWDPMDCNLPRLLCPWDSPGRNTGVGWHFLLQEIVPTQGSNLGLPYCRQMLYHLSHQGNPMLSRLVITFLPRSKHFNFLAAVTICSDFGASQNKVWHCFHCFPIYFPWSDGTRCHDLRFLNVEF